MKLAFSPSKKYLIFLDDKLLVGKILPTLILSILVVCGKFSLAVKFRKPKIRDSIKK